MTILEMLDRLEAEIVSLRSDRSVRSDGRAEKGSGLAEVQPKKKKAAVRSKRVRSDKKKRAGGKASGSRKKVVALGAPGEQMSLPAGDEAADKEAARVLGKRQALGRSLSQLRRSSSTRLNENQESS